MLFWQLLPTSHRILLALSVLYFVNMALGGMLTSYLALFPAEMVARGEYWRIVTYPFAVFGFWSMLSTGCIFYFFAPEVEQIVTPKKFLIASAFFVVLHSVIYTPLFFSYNLPLTGPEALALAILTVYTYIYPRGEISLFGVLTLKASVLLLAIVCLSLLFPVFRSPFDTMAIIHVFANQIFGVLSGFLFSYLVFGSDNDFMLSLFSRKQPLHTAPRKTPSPTASVGFTSPLSTSHLEDHLEDHDHSVLAADELDEDRLNFILDKIYEKGQHSLTNSEKKFLEEYAKKLS